MNNAFFSIDMKAYQSDIFNMQIESCDSLLQWLSFAFRIKSKLFTTIEKKKKKKGFACLCYFFWPWLYKPEWIYLSNSAAM